METTDKNKLFVLAILLVLLASWVIGNFLYVVVKSTSKSQQAVFSPDDIGKTISGDDDSDLFNILMTVFIIMIIVLLAITIIGILFESDMTLLTQISVVILVILISTTIFATRLDDDKNGGEEGDPMSGDLDLPTGKNIFDKTTSYGHIIFPIILLSITLLIVYEWRSGNKGNIDLKTTFEEEVKRDQQLEKKKNISSDFEDIRSKLIGRTDVRDAIIKAYKNMMNIFEKEGIGFEPSMTSREFMNYAMKYLDVSDETISDITNLFEEARYSSHELDEAYRDQALKDLKKLEEELKH